MNNNLIESIIKRKLRINILNELSDFIYIYIIYFIFTLFYKLILHIYMYDICTCNILHYVMYERN